ncbi:MAG: hypothetical protein E6G34_05255 [Actinobacteria bacterium]|nr:MAG: hypothetical protein E6G34_05255 [Actinomycetota bacterium]
MRALVDRARLLAAWAEQRPLTLPVLALLIALLASVAMAGVAGFGAVDSALGRAAPGWLGLILGARLAAYAGYTLAHRATLTPAGQASIPVDARLKLVAFGAAATSLAGGFATDHRAMRGAGASSREATVRVLSLGALEWATLAPVAWISALTLLGSARVQDAVTVPWSVGVPVGCALAGAAAWRLSAGALAHKGPLARALARVLDALSMLREQLRHPLLGWAGWLGMSLYWAAEIVSLWAALRLFALHPSAAVVILGYATGHVLTPRSVPLSGVGITEVLLPLALMWVGLPLAAAVPAVFVYRGAVLALSIPPALLARGQVRQLLGARRAPAR